MRLAQRSFDDLGTHLAGTTFVAVDLETTGGTGPDSITEIGAVKVRGGEVLAEFQTLVDPGCAIPPFITVLTGITTSMLVGAPTIEQALPAFLEFAGDAVFAHNASFDSRFLSSEADRLGYGRLENEIVCTVRLARRLVRDEVPNLKLETLARALRGRAPSHRALDDARACADVFHALLELAGRWGVSHLEDLLWFQTAGGHPQARKRSLADALPRGRGVYLFRDSGGGLLYVGKATDLRTRVRSYFGDDRKRMNELLRELHSVDHHATRIEIESSVLEARLIRRHRPPYNRAQRGRKGAGAWVRLTQERFPRVTVARTPGANGIGPLPAAAAHALREALEEAAPVRRCNDKIGPATRFEPCALAGIGRCFAPCDNRITPDAYAAELSPIIAALGGDPTLALTTMSERIERLCTETRYEDAAATRDRAFAMVTALSRRRAMEALASAGRLVVDTGGVTVEIDDGALVAVAGRALPVPPDGHPDEARMLWRWLSRDSGIRLLSVSGSFALPADGGRTIADWLGRMSVMRRGARSGT